jgi:hypothetical protein
MVKLFAERGWSFEWEWKVTITVQRKLMSAFVDLSNKIRMTLSMLPDQEECGMNVVLRK